MIDVRLYANLAPATGAPGDPQDAPTGFRVEARPGLTVEDVVAGAGIRAKDVYIVMVNGERARLDSPLADGDRLGLFPAISGG